MPYKAVLFDLDGTLLDTLGDLTDATNATLRTLGAPEKSADEVRYLVGNGVRELVRRALPESMRDDATLARALALQAEAYSERWDRTSRPYESIPELLRDLKRSGLTLAILSNKPDDFTRLCVTQLLPVKAFDLVQGARDGIPRKPNPAAAIEIAGRLNVLPEETLYLGDTDTDMQTAVGAGMHPVGVLWGFRPREELLRHGAKTLIERPGELLELIAEPV